MNKTTAQIRDLLLEKPPLCIDCANYARYTNDAGQRRKGCIALKGRENLVTGKPEVDVQSCYRMRDGGPCGREGKLFKPRRPLWRRLLRC